MDIPFIEQAKIQAQVLVPLVRAFQEEFGEERANEVARRALAEWARTLGRSIAELGGGTPVEKMAASMPMFTAGDALDFEVLKQTPEALEFNVTGCRYAQFYRELGAPELGFMFLCSLDFPMAQALSPDLEFERTQTIMEGAPYCDFRYRLKGGRR
jgi:predicted ArsR family transcriptional regulator